MTEDDTIQHVYNASRVQCDNSGSETTGCEVVYAISHIQASEAFCAEWMEAQAELQPAFLLSIKW